MASSDVMAFSPSPFKQFQGSSMSSSPLLPSPSEIFKMKGPVLKNDTRAGSIPLRGLSSLTSATTLLKTHTLDDLPDLKTSRSQKGAKANSEAPLAGKVTKTHAKKVAPESFDNGEGKVPKVRRKPIIKDIARSEDVLEEKKPSKRRTNTESTYFESEKVKVVTRKSPRLKKFNNLADEPAKDKPARKPRAKKNVGNTQAKLPKVRVTKSSLPSKATKPVDGALPASPGPFEDSIDFGLVKAVRRMDGWSPPNQYSKDHGIHTNEATSDSRTLSPDANASSSNGFNNLLVNFGFTSSERGATEMKMKMSDREIIRKRKLIELVETNKSISEPLAPKSKAPKKKAKTITEQATSAYAEEEVKDPSVPLLQYFTYQTSDRSTDDGFKIPAKPHSRSRVKNTTKINKGTLQIPILLSPEAAMEQVHKQDFVFGTSSQLAREESPSYLRDLHDAMQASNEMVDDPFDDPFVDIADEPSAVPPAGKYKRSTKRDLWSEGARNTTKSLLDVEVVDMIYTPAATRTDAPRNTHALPKDSPTEWHDIDEEVAPSTEVPAAEAKTPSKPGPVEAAIREILSSSPNILTPKVKSPKVAKKAKSKDALPPNQPRMVSAVTKEPGMPDFEAYTTFQLEKQIAKYHFKPIKSRDAMISLLQRCWEDQHRLALATLQPNVKPSSPSKAKMTASVSSQTAPSTPKKRGQLKDTLTIVVPPAQAKSKAKARRPKRNDAVDLDNSDMPLSKTRTPRKSPQRAKSHGADEIYDSDTHITPSPPRRRPSQIRSPPRALKLSTSSSTEDSVLSPASSQESLFKHITKAVKAAPMTKDPSRPSWQEKILLYDPIVIEDLTLWLNTGALEKVGWDGECIPKEVKKWCEGKSICCLWRENLRGVTRSRY